MSGRVATPSRPRVECAVALVVPWLVSLGVGCSDPGAATSDGGARAPDAGNRDGGGDPPADAGDPPADGGAEDAGAPETKDAYQRALADLLCRQAVRCAPKTGDDEAYLELACDPTILGATDVLAEPTLRAVFHGSGLFSAEEATLLVDQGGRCLEALATRGCDLLSRPLPMACHRAWESTGYVTFPPPACVATAECRFGTCGPVEFRNGCFGFCLGYRVAGEDCLDDFFCAPWLVCRGGLCELPGAAGAPCDASYDCAPDLWCDLATDTCAPRPVAAEACARRVRGEDPCAGDLVCSGGVCGVGGDVGEPCDPDRPCRPGHRCGDAGRCVVASLPGAPCAGDGACPRGFACVAGACEPRARPGEACGADLPCLVGRCGSDGACGPREVGDPCAETPRALRDCPGACDTLADRCEASLPVDAECARSEQCVDGTSCVGDGTPFGPRCLPCD